MTQALPTISERLPLDTVMAERCATCAFRPGTEASTAPWTQSLVKLCVEVGEAFHCHEAPHLCAGFVEAFTAKLNSEHYAQMPEWRAKVYRALIEAMFVYKDRFEAKQSYDGGEELFKAVRDALGDVSPPLCSPATTDAGIDAPPAEEAKS